MVKTKNKINKNKKKSFFRKPNENFVQIDRYKMSNVKSLKILFENLSEIYMW